MGTRPPSFRTAGARAVPMEGQARGAPSWVGPRAHVRWPPPRTTQPVPPVLLAVALLLRPRSEQRVCEGARERQTRARSELLPVGESSVA